MRPVTSAEQGRSRIGGKLLPERQAELAKWLEEWHVSCGGNAELLQHLRHIGITVLACDFDLTMTSIHSGGYAIRGSQQFDRVTRSLCASFNAFASMAQAHGLRLGVVTFSDANTCSHAAGGDELVRCTMAASEVCIMNLAYFIRSCVYRSV